MIECVLDHIISQALQQQSIHVPEQLHLQQAGPNVADGQHLGCSVRPDAEGSVFQKLELIPAAQAITCQKVTDR